MIPTMRWFGPTDGVSLSDIRQAGCEGIVTALHHIPNGEVWPIEEIKAIQQLIEEKGMRWEVVESLPVSEDIKTQTGDYLKHIQNYKQSLKNLAACGIKVITYNFMPILDWTRTDLAYTLPNGAKALRFEKRAFLVFDLFILEREAAFKQYSKEEIEEARNAYQQMNAQEIQRLSDTLIAGLPGSEEGYSIERFRSVLKTYDSISSDKLRENIVYFLEEIIPIAEELGVQMAIHPDDPPFEILGLPRVISKSSDYEFLFSRVPSLSNGMCFCTGSLGVRADNDLPKMVEQFGQRIYFLHLRNTKRNEKGDFYEDNHLEGDADMFSIVEQVVLLMNREQRRIPMRPDHGHQLLDDLKKTSNPGYSAIGRLKGLAELRGLEYGMQRTLNKRS